MRGGGGAFRNPGPGPSLVTVEAKHLDAPAITWDLVGRGEPQTLQPRAHVPHLGFLTMAPPTTLDVVKRKGLLAGLPADGALSPVVGQSLQPGLSYSLRSLRPVLWESPPLPHLSRPDLPPLRRPSGLQGLPDHLRPLGPVLGHVSRFLGPEARCRPARLADPPRVPGLLPSAHPALDVGPCSSHVGTLPHVSCRGD